MDHLAGIIMQTLVPTNKSVLKVHVARLLVITPVILYDYKLDRLLAS